MCVLDSLETKNFISFPTRVGPPWSLRGGSFTFHRSKGSRVGAGPGGAWGSGVGLSRCQAAREGPPNAGRLRRAVGRRPRGAGAHPSFLPPNPFLSRLAFPGILRIPQPPAAAFALLSRPGPPSPAPACSPSSPASPRGPPRPGPLPLVAAAPFTIALPASPPLGSRFAPARCPLGACALRSAAAAAAAPFFLKGNAEALGVTVGEGEPEPRRPPGEAADPPPGVGGFWADPSLPPPS